MSVNPHIRFGISKLGHYFLDFIPKEEIDRYLHRLNFYSTNFKVVVRKQKLKISHQQVCYVVFFQMEKALRDKLIVVTEI